MANTIILKRSATPGKVPTTSQLALGEIAINTHDGLIYIKKDDGTPSVVQIGGVTSVNSKTGSVVIDTGDLTENGNLFFTNARARSAVSAGTGINYNSSTGIISTSQSITTSASPTFAGLTLTGNATSRSIIPAADNTYSLGSSTYQWKDVFVGPGSLYINGVEAVHSTEQTLTFSADTDQNIHLTTSGAGVLQLGSSSTTTLVEGPLQIQSGAHILDSAGVNVQFGSAIHMNSNKITNVGAPSNSNDAATKSYVDTQFAAISQSSLTKGDSKIEIIDSGTGQVIVTVDGSTALTVTSDGVVIAGNMTVNGTTTTVNSNTVSVADNIITLNSDVVSGAPTQNAGVEVSRGDSAKVALRWNEGGTYWQFTNDGATYYPMATSTTDLAEGSNLYFTNARARSALTASTATGISYNSSTGNFTLGSIPNTSLANNAITINGTSVALGGTRTLGTDDVSEGSTNLYFTNSRARSALSAGTGISYNSSTGAISTSAIPNSSLANSSVTVGTTAISLGSSSTTLGGLTSVTSTSFTGALTGNADTATTATKWAAARTLSLSGDLSGSVSFDGSANVTLNATVINNSVALGADTTGDYVQNLTAGSGITVSNNSGEGSTPTVAVDSTVVALKADTHYIGTTSVALNRSSGNLALTGITSVTMPGSVSGSVQVIPAAAAGTGTVLTLPATTGTVITSGDTGTVTNTMLAGSIANAKLANSSVTVGTTAISLGSSSTTLAGLTSVTSTGFTGALTGNADTATTLKTARTINGVSFDGSANITVTTAGTGISISGTTISLDTATSIDKTTAQTLTNKSLSDSTTYFIDDVDGTKKLQFQVSGITTGTTRTLTAPDVNGTIITTGDTGTVTNAMLAGSIANSKLANSTISGVSLGSNLNALTIGTGLSGTSYNGSSAVTIANTGVLSVNGSTGAITGIANSSDTTYIGTTGVALNRSSGNLALAGITSVTFPGSTSGSVQLIPAAAAGSGTVLTMPATTGTVITSGDTGTVTNTMLAGSIATSKITGLATSATTDTTNASNITSGTLPNARLSSVPNSALANSSITVNGSSISLGGSATVKASTTNALTIGTGLSGSSFDGSGAVTIAIDSTVATLSGTQTLTNKTLTDSTTYFNDETDSTKKMQFQLSGITTATTRTLTVPDVNGTIITTGDTGTVTNTMLAGSITNAKLSNSSLTVTAGTGLSGGGSVSLGGSVTLTNAGVTSNVAGTGITVSGATGAVTISNAGVTNATAGTGISVSAGTGNVTFTNTGVTSIAGTANQITASASTGGVTLSLPSSVTMPGDLTISGNLTVSGTTTTVSSTTLSVADKNIELAKGSSTDAAADGGGITLHGTTDHTWNWVNSTAAWTSSDNIATAAGKSLLLNGSTSGTITVTPTAVAGTNTITLPATTGTVVTTGDTGSVTNTMLAGSIANAKLANSTISGVALGNNLNALTIGTGLSGSSYNGSGAVTIAIDSTVATLTGSQTLTNKTLTTPVIGSAGATFNGSTSGTAVLSAPAVAGSATAIVLPSAAGTLVGSGDTGTVTNTMLAGSIANAKLANSSVTVTAGTGLSGGGAVSLGGTVTLTNAGVTSITTNTGLSTNASATGAVTITNTGVTSNVAGTGITVSGATGAVTITNSGVTSITGTANQVTASASTGGVTLSLPQSIATSSSPTFATVTHSTSGVFNGSTSGAITLQAAATAGTNTITLPATTGTVVTTGDSGTVTNTMLAGSIANAKLANSSVTVNGTAISLGSSGTITANTTNALTIGTGLSGSSFNGSGAVTIAIDSTVATLTGAQTLTNKTLTSPVIGGTGAVYNGSTSGTTTLLASATASGTLTLPAATDTLVGKATTDTLTNKTISGSSNTLSNIANASLTNSSVTVTAGTGLSGGGAVSLGGSITLTNAGVTSNVAGSGISVSGATGAVTITSTDTLDTVSSRGASTGNAITLTNATASSSKTTGALIVTGGVGISGALYVGGEVTAYASDAALKTNVVAIDNALSKVEAIRGVSYDWNAEGQALGLGTDKQIGVIAQEVEAVLPELVVQSAHEGYKTVKYDKLTALLIEAVKDLSAKVKTLEAQLNGKPEL